MTLSPTSNVTVPPVRKLSMAGQKSRRQSSHCSPSLMRIQRESLENRAFLAVSPLLESSPIGLAPEVQGLERFEVSTGATQPKSLNPMEFRAAQVSIIAHSDRSIMAHAGGLSSRATGG